MIPRRLAVLVLALVLPAGTASAIRRPDQAGPRAAGLEARAARVRTEIKTSTRVPQRAALAWTRFAAATPAWQAVWDDATGVPLRLFGRGVSAPRASADPAAALGHARATLAAHLDLLAPGAAASDFVLAANVARNGVRTVAFRQHKDGLPVIGGQLSFRYKHDRLIAIASEALPHVRASRAARSVEPTMARLLARTWVTGDLRAATTAGKVDGPYILPLVGDGGVLGYRTVVRVDTASDAPVGRWDVYVDAGNGDPVARRQRLSFADGTLRYEVPLRRPGSDRAALPAVGVQTSIDNVTVVSGEGGALTWGGDAAGALVTRVTGPQVGVANQAGDNGTGAFTIQPGGEITWSAPGDQQLDAQLTAFVHTRVAKDYARARFAPDLAWLDEQMPVNVNINEQCNAFSDGNSINFFLASQQCENTGRLPDVVYHEFGHSLHAQSIIDGAGAFDGAFSEGLSDYLAATITGDPAMGVGFFLDDSPLRHIDPPDREHRYPEDVAEIHYTGLIFAGAMWDLRKILVDKYGEADGALLADRLFYGAVQRASSIPATYVEILVEDDDDGDLSNGTPNACEINAAFGAHGLRQVGVELTPLSQVAPGGEGYAIDLTVAGLLPQCAGDGVASASIEWLLRTERLEDARTIEMTETDGTWTATIPGQDEGAVVRYAVVLGFQDGSSKRFPDNVADPRYEFYVGDVVELYCTGFETDPFTADGGWTHGLSRGEPGEGADDWSWGTPSAPGGAADPAVAFAGDGVIGNDLGGEERDGLYQADKTNFARSPAVSIAAPGGGRYSDVRLQYWRWLNVEDAFFDQATIYANATSVWQNYNSNDGDQSATQHTDREWRFHDVPLSEGLAGDDVQLTFEIASDGGLEFGGWTIDELCVVAAAGKICGDGELVDPEQCDDGPANSDTAPDACRSTCRAATCGDGIVDSAESCDDGNTIDGDGCAATCGVEDDGGDCGCRVGVATGPSTGGVAVLLLGLVGVVRLRRRRR